MRGSPEDRALTPQGCWNLEQHWLQQKHHLQLETLGIGGPGHRKQVCSGFEG